jgi:hypothetical protein
MMQAWADLVDAARDGAKVIPSRFGKAAWGSLRPGGIAARGAAGP